MYLSETYEKKWPVLDHPELPEVKDSYKRAVTSVILENQESLKEDQAFFVETPTNAVSNSGVSNWDPILISLVRRFMPNLIAYDICGVQPMTGSTGLIFAMRSRFTTMSGTEELYLMKNDTDFSGRNATGSVVDGFSETAHSGTNPALLNDSPVTFTTGTAMSTAWLNH